LFRIYRDTRFSKDKIPYKTNFGASLGMGKGSQKGGYYLHLEPGKSFLRRNLYAGIFGLKNSEKRFHCTEMSFWQF
jgi:uncharacterized protein (DUF2461 family)